MKELDVGNICLSPAKKWNASSNYTTTTTTNPSDVVVVYPLVSAALAAGLKLSEIAMTWPRRINTTSVRLGSEPCHSSAPQKYPLLSLCQSAVTEETAIKLISACLPISATAAAPPPYTCVCAVPRVSRTARCSLDGLFFFLFPLFR